MASMRKLDRIVRAYLPDAGISSVGPPGQLREEAPAVEILDVQVRTSASCLHVLPTPETADSPGGGGELSRTSPSSHSHPRNLLILRAPCSLSPSSHPSLLPVGPLAPLRVILLFPRGTYSSVGPPW